MSARRDNRSGRNGRWYYRKQIRLPDGRRVRISGVPTTVGLPDTKEGAEQAERDHIERVRKTGETTQTPEPPKEVPTLEQFAPTFLDVSGLSNKESWLTCKRALLRLHILPAMGHKRLDEIDYAVIEDFKLMLAAKPCVRVGMSKASKAKPRTLARKTINNVLTVLRRSLQIAKKRGLIAAVPEFEWFRTPPPEFDFLTFHEAEQLLAAAEGEARTMILVALRTGLRFGELIGLRWQDVDLAAGRITVRQQIYRGKTTSPKSGKGREIPLSKETCAALKQHRHLRGSHVFCDLGGTPLRSTNSVAILRRAVRRAGLRHLGWHMLRHTFASHLAMRGAPLKAIQEMLGHATIQMTMRYAHLAPEIARESVDMLDMKLPRVERGSVVAATAESVSI